MLFFSSRFRSASPKLPLRSAMLSLGCSVAMLPGGSTETKLARTLLVRRSPPLSASALSPLGDRPRGSWEGESDCLFSNSERRLRTAEDERFSEDMAAYTWYVNACPKCMLCLAGIVLLQCLSADPHCRGHHTCRLEKVFPSGQ